MIPPSANTPVDDDATGRKNMQQLIQLRWIAVLGQVGTILVVFFVFRIELPLLYMFAVLAGLVAFNGASLLRLRLRRPVSNGELFVALLVDVITLTMQLYLSGGATNPFIFLYLLQVVLAAVLLEAWSTWIILLVTAGCFVALEFAARPLPLPLDYELGPLSLYIQGMLLCFVLNAVLLVIFINRITRNRRDRDARLAALRQRAAEEEHIVRMGLLASGAAHELGTPLATLAVILGDWRRMPVFQSDPDLAQEIGEMQTQVLRCKSIVSGILLSAGEARGEASEETTVHAFVDELVAEWRTTRPVNDFEYRNLFGEDRAIISDSALKQTVHNVLDNALEASPHWVGLEVSRRDDTLIVSVMDQGAGFSEAMLSHLGRPYQSTKGRPGGGLGLFLVFNVVRTLGGNVSAGNRPQGGAVVTLTLPLSALTIDEQEIDEQRMDEPDRKEGGYEH
ncbi:ATP-binding protein [Alloalcanivorax venustensis]|jgi:two-component system sensor histidine kinase RegB|uniref:ATP-binding protein n=2 Tax=Alloalcanivorax TaxID=3020832 RepID=UPI000798C03A|nr:MAG: histidine kinase [Alcanivorax sp. Nap_24]MAD71289.1 histidine kinase [Alcanivorax sp.]MEA3259407.1 ATP-binding protein [Pseudomonadota bacterium]MBL4723658.1 HAMP domain-containing histidine kinase [Alcanivorax sp.]MCH2552417.1 ATP-binding protein [Alcanivorax sp.]|tara:strand:+ start:41568 stop:42920 length:1353 start_codon:yes stop_codon:yes gene_type:complete